MDKPRPIIVIGPERSGTSVVADMICRWGAYPGEPERQRTADENNPNGYFEYLPIWEFLEELGTNWWDENFQVEVKGKASDSEHRKRAIEMVLEMEAARKPWIWKDPALSFFLPFWKQIWVNPIYVVTMRNPLDVALSWQKFATPSEHGGMLPNTSTNLLRWHYIMSLILENTEDIGAKIFISFERLMQEPEEEARRLGDFLGIDCGCWEPNGHIYSSMSEAVHPELRRHWNSTPFEEVTEATPELKNLYSFSVMKIENPDEPFTSSEFPMQPGWRDRVAAG